MKIGLLLIIGMFGFALFQDECGSAGILPNNSQNLTVTPASQSPTQIPTTSPTISPIQSPTVEPALPPKGFPMSSAIPPGDFDCDGIPNRVDNCVWFYNPDQKTRVGVFGYLVGDACFEPGKYDIRCDNDKDGINNLDDNCQNICNPDQKDSNKNGAGDACELIKRSWTELVICKKPRPLRLPKSKKSSNR